MLAIYKREVKAYLYSVTGWLFIAATICLAGFYFFIINLNYGYANLAETISSVIYLLLLTTPVLAMRILSEERKQKTDQMILTAPVSIAGITVGKYLAMATIFTIPVVVICFMPLLLTQFGKVPMGESYTAILVYYLFGLTCLAIGLFISSLTESQVIAAVLTFGVLFLGYMMDGICSFLSYNGNILTDILSVFAFYPRISSMMGGTLDLKAALYFVTLIVVFLFLTTQSIQKRRYQVSVKTIQLGAYSSGMTLLVLAIAVFLNLAASVLPDSYTTLDVSRQKLYSLSLTTKSLLNKLEDDVTIYAIVAEDSQDTVLEQTLKRYQDETDHIKVVYKDPVVEPMFYKEYADNMTMNSLIVESDKRFKVVNYDDIYEETVDYETYSSAVTGYDAEGQITSAIAYVTGDDAPKMYELTGHGEAALSDTFVNGLKKENADLESLTLLTSENVPEDADGVIINAPAQDLNPEDVEKLTAYLDQGGKILLATSYMDDFSVNMPNLTALIGYFGLSVGDGLLVEADQNYMYQTPIYLMPEVKNNTLTNGVYGSDYDIVMFPYGQSIDVEETENVAVTTLLSTTKEAYEKTELAEGNVIEKAETDRTGAFTVGAQALKNLGEKSAELVLYTSGFVFTDEANQYTMDNNLRLFTNAVSSFSGEGESISIPVKSYETQYLTVTVGAGFALGALFAIIIPVILLIFGIVIWYRRRRR